MKLKKWFDTNLKWIILFFLCLSIATGSISIYQNYSQPEEKNYYTEIPEIMLRFWNGSYVVEGEVINYTTSLKRDPVYNLSIDTVTIIDENGYERPLSMVFDMENTRIGNYQGRHHNAVIWGDYVQFVGEWFDISTDGGNQNIFRCFYYRQIYDWKNME